MQHRDRARAVLAHCVCGNNNFRAISCLNQNLKHFFCTQSIHLMQRFVSISENEGDCARTLSDTHIYTERHARGAICFEYTFPVFLAELLSTNSARRRGYGAVQGPSEAQPLCAVAGNDHEVMSPFSTRAMSDSTISRQRASILTCGTHPSFFLALVGSPMRSPDSWRAMLCC